MKDKIKARYDEFKNDPFSQGMLVGGAIGIGSVVVAGRFFGVNFDHKGLYLPDRIINEMRETNEMILAHTNNAQVVIALVPKP